MFVISGTVIINGNTLETRDGLEISETQSFTLDIAENSQVLLMEVPLHI